MYACTRKFGFHAEISSVFESNQQSYDAIFYTDNFQKVASLRSRKDPGLVGPISCAIPNRLQQPCIRPITVCCHHPCIFLTGVRSQRASPRARPCEHVGEFPFDGGRGRPSGPSPEKQAAHHGGGRGRDNCLGAENHQGPETQACPSCCNHAAGYRWVLLSPRVTWQACGESRFEESGGSVLLLVAGRTCPHTHSDCNLGTRGTLTTLVADFFMMQ